MNGNFNCRMRSHRDVLFDRSNWHSKSLFIHLFRYLFLRLFKLTNWQYHFMPTCSQTTCHTNELFLRVWNVAPLWFGMPTGDRLPTKRTDKWLRWGLLRFHLPGACHAYFMIARLQLHVFLICAANATSWWTKKELSKIILILATIKTVLYCLAKREQKLSFFPQF